MARASPTAVGNITTELRQYGVPSSGLAGGAEPASASRELASPETVGPLRSRLQKATAPEPSGGSKVSDSQAYAGLDLAAMLGDKISHDAASSSGRSRGDNQVDDAAAVPDNNRFLATTASNFDQARKPKATDQEATSILNSISTSTKREPLNESRYRRGRMSALPAAGKEPTNRDLNTVLKRKRVQI